MGDKTQYDYSQSPKVKDSGFNFQPEKTFSFSPFSITEIQYLRGLVMADKLQNDYEYMGEKALIDRKTTMHEFTEKILKTFDELER